MVLSIDNFDSAGARDYTAWLDAERPPRVLRRLNRPAELRAFLCAGDGQFVVPVRGARVALARNSGEALFTGYVSAAPEYEYLGWGDRGPVYRYVVRALSDESRLAGRTLPWRIAFVDRPAGDALKQLAEDAAPGAFDTSGIESLDPIAFYSVDSRKDWPAHAAALALRAGASYRAHDGRLFFRPLGAEEHALDERSPGFSPEALKLDASPGPVNDVTIAGAVEPGAFVRDYFLGDGWSLRFDLAEQPFTRSGSVIVEEEYRDATLRPQFWEVRDPTTCLAVSGGKLRISGGSGTLGQTMVSLVEPLELGGGLLLQHGDFSFSAASDALAGALSNGGDGEANCFAAFRLTPSAGETQISAVITGVPAGVSVTTVAGRRYLLATRVYASEVYRETQRVHSSAHPAANARGGQAIAADVRVILQVQEIDPNNPASLVVPATVLFDGWVPAAPPFCRYSLLNAAGLHAEIAFTRLARVADAEVRTCVPAGAWRSRLLGAMSEGAECHIGSAAELWFFPGSLPAANEKIVVSYRARSRAVARVMDEASIAAEALGGDDGRRGAVLALAAPPARTSAECRDAALAVLDDSTQPAWSGAYQTWSDFLASDVHPGDALNVNAPSRGAVFRAIVREVEIEAAGLLDDHCRYRLKFANEAAQPAALEFETAPQAAIPEQATTTLMTDEALPALGAAEIVDVTLTEVMIDAGCDPPANGGFEVRRSDAAWGPDNDRNLAGRFDYRVFTVPRTSRSQTWYVRAYDNSAPPRYSRFTTVLHVDYPE
jgi:hypothetical protein